MQIRVMTVGESNVYEQCKQLTILMYMAKKIGDKTCELMGAK